jgi:hypothetical protein
MGENMEFLRVGGYVIRVADISVVRQHAEKEVYIHLQNGGMLDFYGEDGVQVINFVNDVLLLKRAST